MDVNSHHIAVGQEDGKVRLFDLRHLEKRSVNNFDLRMDTEVKGLYYKRKTNREMFSALEIVKDTQDIFCSYDNSAFVIKSSSSHSDFSIF